MIMVTGASGRFSSAVLAELRARGIPAVGGSRTPSAGQRHVDFSAPDSLDFNGVDTLLLVPAGAQRTTGRSPSTAPPLRSRRATVSPISSTRASPARATTCQWRCRTGSRSESSWPAA